MVNQIQEHDAFFPPELHPSICSNMDRMRAYDQHSTPASMLRSRLRAGFFTRNEVMANLARKDEENTHSNPDVPKNKQNSALNSYKSCKTYKPHEYLEELLQLELSIIIIINLINELLN